MTLLLRFVVMASLASVLCPRLPVCDPVVDDMITLRDDDHPTSSSS